MRNSLKHHNHICTFCAHKRQRATDCVCVYALSHALLAWFDQKYCKRTFWMICCRGRFLCGKIQGKFAKYFTHSEKFCANYCILQFLNSAKYSAIQSLNISIKPSELPTFSFLELGYGTIQANCSNTMFQALYLFIRNRFSDQFPAISSLVACVSLGAACPDDAKNFCMQMPWNTMQTTYNRMATKMLATGGAKGCALQAGNMQCIAYQCNNNINDTSTTLWPV